MNLVADEGIDRHIVERLRKDGHTVWYVAEMSPSISDQEVSQFNGLLRDAPKRYPDRSDIQSLISFNNLSSVTYNLIEEF